MRVVRVALGGVGGEIVVVVGERGKGEAVFVEGLAHTLRLRLVEGVCLHVARGERPVAQVRPGGELERLVPVRACPGGDLIEAALGHARGEEAKLHVTAGSRLVATSTQRDSRAEVSTASVMWAARRPSANVGIAATGEPSRTLS